MASSELLPNARALTNTRAQVSQTSYQQTATFVETRADARLDDCTRVWRARATPRFTFRRLQARVLDEVLPPRARATLPPFEKSPLDGERCARALKRNLIGRA